MSRCRNFLCFVYLLMHLVTLPVGAQTPAPLVAARIETGPDGRPVIVRGSEQIPPYILFIQTNERWKDCLPPNPPAWFLRAVAQSAGCHLYVTVAPEPGDGVYASPGMLFIHAGGDGTRTFSIPATKDIYRWDGGNMTLLKQASTEWSESLKAKTTSIYVFR